MADALKPPRRGIGLELWANGTAGEIEQLRAAVAGIGLIVAPATKAGHPGPPVEPVPMGGTDRGRYRWSVRVHVRDPEARRGEQQDG